MTTNRDDLREQLVAAMEAAPELPKEGRQHLADVFLDRLNADYDLVPRGAGRAMRGPGSGGRPWWKALWVRYALVAVIIIATVGDIAHHHVPGLLLIAAVVYVAYRVMRSRRMTFGGMR